MKNENGHKKLNNRRGKKKNSFLLCLKIEMEDALQNY